MQTGQVRKFIPGSFTELPPMECKDDFLELMNKVNQVEETLYYACLHQVPGLSKFKVMIFMASILLCQLKLC